MWKKLLIMIVSPFISILLQYFRSIKREKRHDKMTQKKLLYPNPFITNIIIGIEKKRTTPMIILV